MEFETKNLSAVSKDHIFQKDRFSLDFQKPVLYLTWLTKECPRYSQYKAKREKATALLEDYDKTEHDQNSSIIAKKLGEKGYSIEKNRCFSSDFDAFEIRHYVDIFGRKNGSTIVVELKPRDLSYYDNQYRFAIVLLRENDIDCDYWVFGYRSGKWTKKIISEIDRARHSLLFRAEITLDNNLAQPVPSKYCNYCPYATCEDHPQHSEHSELNPLEE